MSQNIKTIVLFIVGGITGFVLINIFWNVSIIPFIVGVVGFYFGFRNVQNKNKKNNK